MNRRLGRSQNDPRVPAWPLQELLEAKMRSGLSMRQFAEEIGICDRTLFRVLRAETINLYIADELAIKLGSHPAILWPQEYFWPVSAEARAQTA